MKRVILIGLSLVLALGTLGAAFAAWTDEVTITETVSTGEVLVGIVDVGTNDPPPRGVPGEPASYFMGSLDPGLQGGVLVRYEKNVASAESINLGDEIDNTGYYKAVLETIENGYPSYAPACTIEVANLGTIPVIMDAVNFRVVSDPGGLEPFVILWQWEILINGVPVAPPGQGWAGLTSFLQAEDVQLEPGDVMTLILTKHIEQEVGAEICPEGETITVEEVLHFIQWNEAP